MIDERKLIRALKRRARQLGKEGCVSMLLGVEDAIAIFERLAKGP